MWLNTFKLAWRNIWRGTRRTMITIASIALGLTALIVTTGIAEGMRKNLISSATASYLADAQIHAAHYTETHDDELFIPDGEAVLAKALSTPGVRAASPRLISTGLLAIGDRSAALQAVGIDLALEKKVTGWQNDLVAGHYPEKDDEILVGDSVAADLSLDVGGKLVLMMPNLETGDLSYLAVRLAGIVHTANEHVDKRVAMLPIHVVQKGLGRPGALHEIALRLDAKPDDLAALTRILEPLAADGLDVRPWQKLAPLLGNLLEFQGQFLFVLLLIVGGLLGLGITNTLNMSLIERIREFGILRAIGTSPVHVAGLIVAEALCLGIVGAAIGVAIGVGSSAVFARTGVNLGNFSISGTSLKNGAPAELHVMPTILISLGFIVLTMLASLVTAVKASRISAAEALRHD